MPNIKIPAQFWENTMEVIGLRPVPTRTEVSVPMDSATAMPCFTRGLQGSVCRNAFPLLLTLQKLVISRALAPNPHQAAPLLGLEEIARVISAWCRLRPSNSRCTELGGRPFYQPLPCSASPAAVHVQAERSGGTQASSRCPEGRMQVGQCLFLPLTGHISLY